MSNLTPARFRRIRSCPTHTSRWPSLSVAALGLIGCANVLGANFDDAHPFESGAGGVAGCEPCQGKAGTTAGVGGSSQAAGGRELNAAMQTAVGGQALASGGVAGSVDVMFSAAGRSENAGSFADSSGMGGALNQEPNQQGGSSGSLVAGGSNSVGVAGAGVAGGGNESNAGRAAACSPSLQWTNTRDAPTTGRAISPAQLAQSVGVVMNTANQPGCVGVLVSRDLGMFLGCRVAKGDTVHFDHALEANGSLSSYLYPVLGGDLYDTMSFTWLDQNDQVRFAPMKRRLPVAGEPAQLIRIDSDGSALFARVELEPSAFDRVSPSVWDASESTVVFGSDAQLLGFCAYDPCQGLRECISVMAMRAHWWLLPRLLHLGSTAYWGDFDADGRADAVTLDRGRVEVRTSRKTGLGAPIAFSGDFDDELNVLGDVTGDRRADLVSVGSAIRTFVASNGQYDITDPVAIPTAFPESEQGILADVDGDGRSELALMQAQGDLVVVSDIAGNPSVENWASNVPHGYLTFQLVDVTGDRRADAIFGFADHVDVMPSNGRGFDPAATWLTDVHVHPPGWFFADVTGDGLADAIRLDVSASQVFPANGSAFIAAQTDWRSIPLGQRGNAFADVDGDGKFDLIVHDNWGIRVARSTGTDFENLVYLTYAPVMSGY